MESIDEEYAKIMSGQLMFRDSGRIVQDKLVLSVVGLIGVPPDQNWLKNHFQYTIIGEVNEFNQSIESKIYLNSGINRSKEAEGNTLGQLFLESIWRI